MDKLLWPSLGSVLLLGGCATPFAQSDRLDMTPHQVQASITLSQPKVYRREALLNERARDLAWIDDLIDKSTTAVFTPEVIRDVEQITSIAAAIGLSIDPAAGANFGRASDTADLQQEINVLRLQLQLEQLQRDAELYREKLAEQDAPVNQGLGNAATGTAGAPANSVTAPAVSQLAELNTLIAGLRGRLDATGTRPLATNVTGSPADLFRDRSAYRDMLKSARNAASLDELHDFGDRSLIRLSFQATVLPDPEFDKSLAALSVMVTPDGPDEGDIERIYADWLSYLTSVLNAPGQTALPASLIGSNDYFSTLYLETGNATNCRGWFFELGVKPKDGCKLRAFAMPVFRGADPDSSKGFSAIELLDGFNGLAAPARLAQIQSRLRGGDEADLIGAPYCVGDPAKQDDEVYDAVTRSLSGLALFGYLEAEVQNLSDSNSVRDEIDATPSIRLLTAKRTAMQSFVGALDRAVTDSLARGRNCTSLEANLAVSRSEFVRSHSPGRFARAVQTIARQPVRIYEVLPREQVQQVSTLARAATAVQLGASLAASKPGSGVAANAGAAYGRQTMGRAEALERLPAVVGFAGSGGADFGWAIGPEATVDPKGKVKLQHSLKPIDLSVDMSVPAFTSKLYLQVQRQWGPDLAAIAGSRQALPPYSMTVALRPQRGDLQRLTLRLLQPRLADDYAVRADGKAVGPAISACRSTTLWIPGANVFRTNAALVRGQYLDSKSIVIGPGMDGIFLTVPALVPTEDDPPTETSVTVMLFSPFGPPTPIVHPYSRTKVGDQCKPKKDPSADPTIIALSRDTVRVPAILTIRVTGTNLKLVDRVTIGGVQAEIAKVDEKGAWLDVTLAKEFSDQLVADSNAQLEVFVGGSSKAKFRLIILKSK
jgi:hypothetical protein